MMKEHRNLRLGIFTATVLAFAGVILAQTAGEKTLLVNGRSAGAVVREIGGHTYVEIEALARATNGSVTIEPNRVLLTFPVTNAPITTSASAPSAAPVTHGLSTDFKRAAISELANMREWRGAVGAMITYGLAAGSATAQDYHAICEEGMSQASVAATTDMDHSALQLLKNEFDSLSAWANQILEERKALNGARTVNPNSMQNDPALAKITSCGRFLNTMIVSGSFADDSSCH
jgi:hypothetical protein